MKVNKTPLLFLVFAILSLWIGLFFGLFASLQYLLPNIKEILPFTKSRPLHTVSVISFVILSAVGSIYFFITNVEKLEIFSKKLVKTHLLIYILTGIAIYISFALGKMEGREYLAFTPFLTIPILIGWLVFGINYFLTLKKNVQNWQVYYWMFGTGIVFIIYHLSEAHLWLLPFFRENIVKDLTIQWKSYGSFVGSWNMLIYGIAIYLMAKIKNNQELARGKTVFFFYFLGLTNLMLGWAHHTYLIPTTPWIRILAYIVSMTEWIVLAHIIYSWKKTLTSKEKKTNSIVYKLLLAADFWILINVLIALLISIPAINYYTHGTHITVAHSMGTTIGINTTILLASLFYIISKFQNQDIYFKKVKKLLSLYNILLLIFLAALMYAGYSRSKWMYSNNNIQFSTMQDDLFYTYVIVSISGLGLLFVITSLTARILKSLVKIIREE